MAGAVQAIQAGWRDTQQGSLLARSLQRIRQALAPLSLAWQEPPPQAHHVVSAALFALCSPKTSRLALLLHTRRETVSCWQEDDILSRQLAIEQVVHEPGSTQLPATMGLADWYGAAGWCLTRSTQYSAGGNSCREERGPAPGPGKQKLRPALPTEWDSRGDGPALGALLLVGLLGQSAAFQVADQCLGILNATAFDTPAGKAVLRSPGIWRMAFLRFRTPRNVCIAVTTTPEEV